MYFIEFAVDIVKLVAAALRGRVAANHQVKKKHIKKTLTWFNFITCTYGARLRYDSPILQTSLRDSKDEAVYW